MTTDLNRVTESESQARENTRAELVMYNEFNSISCSDDSPESRNRPTIGGQCLRPYDSLADSSFRVVRRIDGFSTGEAVSESCYEK